MHREVTNRASSIRHSKWDTKYKLDEHHNQGGPNYVPSDYEECADNLYPDLTTVAVDSTARVCKAKGKTSFGRGEESGTETADKSADEMSVENIETVVNILENPKISLSEIEGDLISVSIL
jgi:hypothetical protein